MFWLLCQHKNLIPRGQKQVSWALNSLGFVPRGTFQVVYRKWEQQSCWVKKAEISVKQLPWRFSHSKWRRHVLNDLWLLSYAGNSHLLRRAFLIFPNFLFAHHYSECVLWQNIPYTILKNEFFLLCFFSGVSWNRFNLSSGESETAYLYRVWSYVFKQKDYLQAPRKCSGMLGTGADSGLAATLG